MQRRCFLRTSAATVPLLLPGCTAVVNRSKGSSRCKEEDLKRLSSIGEFDRGITFHKRAFSGFTLTVTPQSVEPGDELTIRLENISDTEQITGNRMSYGVQKQTSKGWRDILWIPKSYVFTEEAAPHAPDEGFKWTFRASQAGFTSDPFRVCSDISSNRYRFYYWGIPDSSTENAQAISVQFTVE